MPSTDVLEFILAASEAFDLDPREFEEVATIAKVTFAGESTFLFRLPKTAETASDLMKLYVTKLSGVWIAEGENVVLTSIAISARIATMQSWMRGESRERAINAPIDLVSLEPYLNAEGHRAAHHMREEMAYSLDEQESEWARENGLDPDSPEVRAQIEAMVEQQITEMSPFEMELEYGYHYIPATGIDWQRYAEECDAELVWDAVYGNFGSHYIPDGWTGLGRSIPAEMTIVSSGVKNNPQKTPKIESILFSRPSYTPTTARSWLEAHGYIASNAAMEISEGVIRVRQRRAGGFRKFRKISLGDGIKALVGVK